VRGDICPQCCGTEREETVSCPSDCEFLLQARNFEKVRELRPEELPHAEVQLTQEFLRANEVLGLVVVSAIAEAMDRVPGLNDFDAREALASLTQTYKTLGTGIIYESKPSNPLAAATHELVQLRVGEFRERVQQESGYAGVLDSHVLGVLIFFQRLELQLNNGRRRGRSFLDAARAMAPQIPGPQAVSP
jgi:hypothetical protein